MDSYEEEIWRGAYEIPWEDPDFSRRMLREHLNQNHDLASRRTKWIERQVAWIDEILLRGRPSRILDLGCGPGFYLHRLVTLGHRCLGIDFGPASIDFARQHNPDTSRCHFVLGDIRRSDLRGPFDLAMILFGELNVFSPQEASAILRRVQASLEGGGRLIVELQKPEAVERTGRTETFEERCAAGLFADEPHRCRTESEWLTEAQVAVQRFHVSGEGSAKVRTFRNTTRAWSKDNFQTLLTEAGFGGIGQHADWPCDTGDLELWSARVGTPQHDP
jgi:SAM-dependent methyltransferase